MPSSWSMLLRRELDNLARSKRAAGIYELPRVALVGIGNEFKADDIAGVLIARDLIQNLNQPESVLVLDAGTAPENITGSLRIFAPELVVLFDAVDMQQLAGQVVWLDFDTIEGSAGFTHAPDPSMLGGYLQGELGCRVALIGIQPGSLEFDRPATPAVTASARRVVEGIVKILMEMGYTLS